MDLSIIIVNYNVKEFLQNLLHSIDKATKNIQHEIIIIDNASDDGSIQFIKSKFLPDDRITLIENKENLGFGKANNIGLKHAKGKFILLINPDCLLSEDTLIEMISFLDKNPHAGIAGCKILNPDGSLQLACRRSFPGPWTSFCKVTGLSTFFPKSKIFAKYNLTYLDENKSYEVDAISGSFMMIKKDALKRVNGFDEDFFMYGEDLDLCYRFQKAGFKVYYVHSTQIIHYKGESTRRSSIDETKIFYDAMHLFVKKHFSSFLLVEIILRSAIVVRKFFAFIGKKKLIIIPLLVDIILFESSIYFAEEIYSSISKWGGFPDWSFRIVYSLPVFIQVIILLVNSSYKKDSLPVLRTVASILVGFFVLSSITYFFKQYGYSRAVLLITYAFVFFSFISWRAVAKLFFKIGIEGGGPDKKRTVVIGTNKEAIQIAQKLQKRSIDYHNVIGLIGFSKNEIGSKSEQFEILGTTDILNRVIKNYNVNEVVFSSEEISYSQMMAIVASCQKENIEFKLIGKSLEFIVGKTSVSMLDDIPVIEIKYNISRPLFRSVKFLFDILLGVVTLFLIYPFIYLAVWLGKKPTPFTNMVVKIPFVVSGKMSFVGPRKSNPDSEVFLGKKGLTGFWFIEEVKEEEKLEIFYARNQSLWLDLEVLGKTILKIWNRN